MKILNFTAVEILPALLNKSKCQTIRPAWKQHPQDKILQDWINKEKKGGKTDWQVGIEDKPSRFKIGEKVQLGWKVRGTPANTWYRNYDGVLENEGVMLKHNPDLDIYLTTEEYVGLWKDGKVKGYFPKLLGTAEIESVRKITMVKTDD